ncbi:Gibberellin-regulated protein 8 [Bienertia sinuspersici]
MAEISLDEPEMENVYLGEDFGIDCGSKCATRCSKSGHAACMTFCQKCCERCRCVPSGTYGNKHECPCYRDMRNSKGGPKCP